VTLSDYLTFGAALVVCDPGGPPYTRAAQKAAAAAWLEQLASCSTEEEAWGNVGSWFWQWSPAGR